MKTAKQLLVLFFFLELISLQAVGQSKGDSPQNQSKGTLNVISVFANALGSLPGKTACVANEYRDILRLGEYRTDDTGASNSGFISAMEETYKGSHCFRVALDKFYQEVDKIDAATSSRSKFLTRLGAPRFTSSVDDLKNEQYKAGALYEAAKKVAGNDPMLAMQLIAFCGHDDIHQTSDPDTSKVYISCPQKDSFMYFNGSLVSIGKSQLPMAGKKALEESRGISNETPAKNYHVLTGSYIGCRFAEKCQLSEIESSQYERKASIAYRLLRMRSARQDLERKYSEAISKYKADLKSGQIKSDPFQALTNNIYEILKKKSERDKKSSKDMGDFVKAGKSTQSDAQLKAKASQEGKKVLAHLMIDDSLIGSSMKLLGQITFNEIGNENATYNFLAYRSAEMTRKCQELSPDKCEEILKELDSWNADLIWTANQHSIGAKFGASQCQNSRQQRAGAKPPVCAAYEKEPDLTAQNMVKRQQVGEKTIGPATDSGLSTK